MTDCSKQTHLFSSCKSRKVQVDFQGGRVSSDGGVLLLRQVDRKLQLISNLSKQLADPRQPGKCQHDLSSLLKQRIYGIALGYEDLNDHDHLRKDPAFQTGVDRDQELASSPTLCRLENRSDRKHVWAMHEVIIDNFIRSFKKAPKELILDFDATDDAVHGKQEGRFFHGYYDHYCFLPLYVFCDDQLLVSYLRPSKIDAAKHSWAILSLLVKQFRKAWPGIRIIFRADSGFCRWRMLSWCEKHGVHYIVGIARNAVLERFAAIEIEKAREAYEKSGEKVRHFSEFDYKAGSWDKTRRVILKAEVTHQGSNPRFVLTNMKGGPQKLYDKLYCKRGNMENRIKEQQLALFADRTSAHRWWTNQFRLMLSSFAYVLMESIRRLALHGTELSKAQCGTIRLKLLKIGAVISTNTRRIRFHLSSHYPYQKLFLTASSRLSPG